MDGNSLSAAASTIAALLGLLFLAAGAAHLLRRWRVQLPARGSNGQSLIRIISSRPLGVQQSLIIAEADGVRFLIGVSRSGITAIGQLHPAEQHSHD